MAPHFIDQLARRRQDAHKVHAHVQRHQVRPHVRVDDGGALRGGFRRLPERRPHARDARAHVRQRPAVPAPQRGRAEQEQVARGRQQGHACHGSHNSVQHTQQRLRCSTRAQRAFCLTRRAAGLARTLPQVD